MSGFPTSSSGSASRKTLITVARAPFGSEYAALSAAGSSRGMVSVSPRSRCIEHAAVLKHEHALGLHANSYILWLHRKRIEQRKRVTLPNLWTLAKRDCKGNKRWEQDGSREMNALRIGCLTLGAAQSEDQ